MIRGLLYPHECQRVEGCAMCRWERGERWGSQLRPLSFYERFLLSRIGEGGSLAKSGPVGAETPAGPCHTTRDTETRRHA